MILGVVCVLVIAVGYYFKVVKPKEAEHLKEDEDEEEEEFMEEEDVEDEEFLEES